MVGKDIRFFNEANENVKINGEYRLSGNVYDIAGENINELLEKEVDTVVVDDVVYSLADFIFEDVEDDYSSNCHCDTYGVCGGYSCPNYANCHG